MKVNIKGNFISISEVSLENIKKSVNKYTVVSHFANIGGNDEKGYALFFLKKEELDDLTKRLGLPKIKNDMKGEISLFIQTETENDGWNGEGIANDMAFIRSMM